MSDEVITYMSQPTWVVGGSIDKELKLFERFTDRAQDVVVAAQKQAKECRQSSVGTGHIVWALLDEPSFSRGMLIRLGVDAEAVRAHISLVTDASLAATDKPPFTPRVKRAFTLALRESLQLGQSEINPGHLLLGIIRLDSGTGFSALQTGGLKVGRDGGEGLARVRRAFRAETCKSYAATRVMSVEEIRKMEGGFTETFAPGAFSASRQATSTESQDSGRNASASVAPPDNLGLRLEALRLAEDLADIGTSADVVVASAKKFEAYLAGGGQ